MDGSEAKWALNRPVSAHITVHYEGENQEPVETAEHVAGSKVVKTVLNIDTEVPPVEAANEATNRSPVRSLKRYSLRETAGESDGDAGVSPASSRRVSNAHSLNVCDFYQCVHREQDHPVARRYSEPRLPHNHTHFQMHQHRSSCASAVTAHSPILRSMSCAADMDPTIIRLPPLTKPRSPRTGEEGSPTSSSSSLAEGHCLDLSCPCTRHHHRRNSVAVKFNKALYKRA